VDITYRLRPANSGFDYLRDNGKDTPRDKQGQRGLLLCDVDEVDSILIDEARTPLIIRGPCNDSTNQYGQMETLIEQLVRKQKKTKTNLLLQPSSELKHREIEAGRPSRQAVVSCLR